MKIESLATQSTLAGLIRYAVDTHAIDGWTQHGPYLVLLRGSARFYTRMQEAEHVIDRLIRDRAPSSCAVA